MRGLPTTTTQQGDGGDSATTANWFAAVVQYWLSRLVPPGQGRRQHSASPSGQRRAPLPSAPNPPTTTASTAAAAADHGEGGQVRSSSSSSSLPSSPNAPYVPQHAAATFSRTATSRQMRRENETL